MVPFLILLVLALAAALSYMVYSFWPVLRGDFSEGLNRLDNDFKVELQSFKAEVQKSPAASPKPNPAATAPVTKPKV